MGKAQTGAEIPSQESSAATDMKAMEISAIALQGLNQAQAQVEQAGGRLASIGANSGDGMPVDSVDLSDAAVSLLSGKNAFATDIKLLKVADEIQGQAVN
jgi:hypothetical protein